MVARPCLVQRLQFSGWQKWVVRQFVQYPRGTRLVLTYWWENWALGWVVVGSGFLDLVSAC